MPDTLQTISAAPKRHLVEAFGAVLAAALTLPVLDAFIRPVCIALQPQLPWIEPVATAHAIGALLLAFALWSMGISPLVGLLKAAAARRGRTALDGPGRVVFLVFGLVPALAALVAFSKAMALGLPISARPGFWLATALVIGLTEEYALRGPLFEVLAKFGPRAAIYGTAVVFALLHLGNFRGAPDPLVIVDQICGTLTTGLCWGCMRWRWRTVWATAAIHGFMDFVVFILADATAPMIHLAVAASPMAAHQAHIALNLTEALFVAGMVWLLQRPVKASLATVPAVA